MKTPLKNITVAGILCSLSAVLFVITGCTLPNHLRLADDGRPKYERVDIVYNVHDGQGTVPARSLQQVAHTDELDESSSNAIGIWSIARLNIEYPHPDKISGMARATLFLSQNQSPVLPSKPTLAKRIALGFKTFSAIGKRASSPPNDNESKSTTPRDELWSLDIPKHQLDLLLVDVEKSGFFKDQTRPTGGADLRVTIDRGKLKKTWTPEPRLDDLVARVMNEGMLEGFVVEEPAKAAPKTRLNSKTQLKKASPKKSPSL